MRKLDIHKNIINGVAFDEASNVHHPAEFIQEHFPAITVMQGIEHTVATNMVRLIGLGPIKDLGSLLNR